MCRLYCRNTNNMKVQRIISSQKATSPIKILYKNCRTKTKVTDFRRTIIKFTKEFKISRENTENSSMNLNRIKANKHLSDAQGNRTIG